MRRCFALVELWSHIYFTPTKKERLLIFDLNRKCGKSYRVSGLVQYTKNNFKYFSVRECIFICFTAKAFVIGRNVTGRKNRMLDHILRSSPKTSMRKGR